MRRTPFDSRAPWKGDGMGRVRRAAALASIATIAGLCWFGEAVARDPSVEDERAACARPSSLDVAHEMLGACSAMLARPGLTAEERADYFFYRANAQEELQRYGPAIADYDAAIQLKPRFDEAIVNRGLAKRRSGDSYGALRDYAAALKINPQHVGARLNRAFVLVEEHMLDAALADLNAALAIDPGSWKAHYSVGAVHAFRQDIAASAAAFQRAFELAPDWIIDEAIAQLIDAGRAPETDDAAALADALARCAAEADC